MPRFVVSDLPHPRITGLVMAIDALWIAGRALTTGLGGELVELDVVAVVLLVVLLVPVLIGPRTIVVDEEGIRVTRRGRVVLVRRLDEVVGVRDLGLASRLVFRDGAWLLWTTTGRQWGPPTDFIVEHIGRTGRAGALSLPAGRIRFPPRCLGCDAAPEVAVELTARRGLDLLFWAYFVQRDIPAPACRACRRRRRGLGVLLGLGPPVGLVGSLFLPLLTPLKGAPVGVLAGLMLLAWLVLRNRGAEWADGWTWGVRAGLAADTTVHLRCRDPRLQAEIEAASQIGDVGDVAPTRQSW